MWKRFIFGVLALFASTQLGVAQTTPIPLLQNSVEPNSIKNVINGVIVQINAAFGFFIPPGGFQEPITTTLGRVVYADQFGCQHNGVDDTVCFSKAATAAGVGGAVVLGPYQYYVGSSLTIPTGVALTCQAQWATPWLNGGGVSSLNVWNFQVRPCEIYRNTAVAFTLLDGASTNGLTFINNATISVPVTFRDLANKHNAYSGTGITMGGNDAAVRNTLLLGFTTCVSSSGFERPVIEWTDCDGDNGFVINAAHDVGKLSHVNFKPYFLSLPGVNGLLTATITNVADNGSGLYRVTTSASTQITTGDVVWIAGVGGARAADGRWVVTSISPTTFDLQGSTSGGPAITGTVTIGQTYIPVSSIANLAPAQTITGTGIPGGTIISAVLHWGSAIIVSNAPTSSPGLESLTIGNGAYTSGGNAYIDLGQRTGTGFTFTNSETAECVSCFSYGAQVGFHLGAGAQWIKLTASDADQQIVLQDPGSLGFLIDTSGKGNQINGGSTNSVGETLVVNEPTAGTGDPLLVSGLVMNNIGPFNVSNEFLQGNVILSGSGATGGGRFVVGPSLGSLVVSNNFFSNATMEYGGNTTAQANVYFSASNYMPNATPGLGVGTLAPFNRGIWIGRQTFCASGCTATGGAYTPTVGTNLIDAQCVGGGAQGGGAAVTAGGQGSIGAGGGSGGWTRKRITSAFSGVTITIGAAGSGGGAGAVGGNGGATTFGAILTANGGTGGSVMAAAATGVIGPVGAGSASGGDINVNGNPGGAAGVYVTTAVVSGAGGTPPGGLGTGRPGTPTATTSNGAAGTGFGAGGSGGANTASQSAASGGNGTGGFCQVDEYQ